MKLKVYDIALVNIIISEIEQVVHKMVYAVTAYPSISLKLSVLRVFCTEIGQPVWKKYKGIQYWDGLAS